MSWLARHRRPILTIVGTILFALLSGWSVHRDSPQGITLGAATRACDALSHGFTTMYVAVLGIGAGLAVVVAMATGIGSLLGLLSNASGSLKAIAKSSLIVMAGLLLAMPGTALIKQVFPQQPSTLAPAAGCPPQAS